MRIARLTGLLAADLPPLEAELGPGVVALVGSPDDAGEVRRAIVWAVAVGDGGVVLTEGRERAGLEPLWGGTGVVCEALEAAVRWMAGPELARVEAARAAATGNGWTETAASPTGTFDGEDLGRQLEDAPEELRARERELRELRAEWAELTGDVEQATMEWLRERQDAETQLQAYRDRARELKARLSHIQTGGPEAPCPTCGRPLADHLKDVRVQLREEWESVVQDGSWWKRRRDQLDGKPEHLQLLESRAMRVQAAVESAARRLEGARAHARQLEARRAPAVDQREASTEVRALGRLAAELESAALDQLLRRAGSAAERITAGRILWIRKGDDGPVGEGGFPGGAPTARDRAAVDVACRIAAAALARGAGAPLGGMVVSEAFEALDPEDRLRAVEELAELAERLGQAVVVTGTDVVDLRPELFATAFELRGERWGTAPLRPLPVGVAEVRLTPSGC